MATLFFRANDHVNGYGLWKSNGTEAGTVLVKDFPQGFGSHPYGERLHYRERHAVLRGE